jgi:hypothetical protein
LSEQEQHSFEVERQESIEFYHQVTDWEKSFSEYLEYHKSKIYIDLRDDKLKAFGIRVHGSNEADMVKFVESNDINLSRQNTVEIDQRKWVFSKIDWKNGILFGESDSYCWIQFEVEKIFDLYPIPELLPIGTLRRLNDLYIFDGDEGDDASTKTKRGRPPLPWDRFHLEVAALAKANALPEKKEAAIQHFEAWFKATVGTTAGRSTIGQKLTPYYEKFMRQNSEKY